MGRGVQVKGRGTGDPVLPNDLERPVHRLGSSCSSGAKNTHNKTLKQAQGFNVYLPKSQKQNGKY